MIPEIAIDPFEIREYDLSTLGIEGELVFEENKTYIQAQGDIYPIYSIGSFKINGGQYILTNGEEEDYSELVLSQDQFEAVRELFANS